MPPLDLTRSARLSVAPMMDWTDRHCRAFHRCVSLTTLLYTEMVAAAALARGGAVHLLAFDAVEHPVALQLGGSEAEDLAVAARMGAERGYDEVNLNVGCPSDRVQSGRFGAVLMREPAHVARLCAAMREAVDVPVTVKCRIGVDEQEPREALPTLLEAVRAVGVERVTIHARKAWLDGLSPKENRDIPPLDYGLVHEMKAAFPDLHVSINGGLATLDAAAAEVERGLDGAMVGRAAYHDPAAVLLDADRRMHGAANPCAAPEDAAVAMIPHIEQHLAGGGRLHQVTRHMLGLFAGRPGARAWRRYLSERATDPDAGIGVLEAALAHVTRAAA
ncbi:tRNA dihydrouridine(20/20a) synthase DusA [Jannaschia sp. Os4]|uniref:tRNA dihydrouridine(20/20a) synthase DusA n=1 Tax=Jannaschia sp. Os4 TaxID=2807617 RepID=UPI0031B5E8A5